MISYFNGKTKNFVLFSIDMSIDGMKELGEQLYQNSIELELFPDRQKRGLDPGIELIMKSGNIKQKIIDLHNENSSRKINLDICDIVVTPKPNIVLKYGDANTIASMSEILIHDRYVGTKKCWVKYQGKSPEK